MRLLAEISSADVFLVVCSFGPVILAGMAKFLYTQGQNASRLKRLEDAVARQQWTPARRRRATGHE